VKIFIQNIPIITIIILGIFIYNLLPQYSPGVVADPTESQKKALDIIVEGNKYLISIAFIILGFFGTVMIGDKKVRKNFFLNILLLVGAALSVLSLIFGYELYDSIITQVQSEIWDFKSDRIIKLRQYEFITLILSSVCLIIFIYNVFISYKSSTDEAPKNSYTSTFDDD